MRYFKFELLIIVLIALHEIKITVFPMKAAFSNMSSEPSADQISRTENYKMNESFNEENIENDSIDISISKDTMNVESSLNTNYTSISTKRKFENSVFSEALCINSTSGCKQVTSILLMLYFVIAN
jgi:hypothetical protein